MSFWLAWGVAGAYGVLALTANNKSDEQLFGFLGAWALCWALWFYFKDGEE